ncbi:MAG: PIN domain-containing protein [Ignavibacteriae bacterium]|nr:PIN domain-containing protein [Ignavibacteriota bacterium]
MACLETTFLIDLLRGEKRIEKMHEELNRTETTFSIAAPSVMELWTGANLSNLPQKEKEKINELISSFVVLHLKENSAKEAGDIESELIRKGQNIEIEDIMIAAIAKVNDEKLVTRDEHYARIPGLKMLKY